MAAELVPDDLLEKIVIGFDVKELIELKRVCKSWHSLISSSRFIKAHLNHKISSDIKLHKTQRIEIACSQTLTDFKNEHDSYLLGSSNGLVCMSSINAGILVANPLTNKAKKLKKNEQIRGFGSLCWGFGHDSSIDDYKVILGFKKGKNTTRFQVLSLKSNVWKDVGEVKYRCITRVGMLCNGALHWFMMDANKKKVILSFHLSEEEFKEIPQPDDDFYQTFLGVTYMHLGIVDECLCVFWYDVAEPEIWIMKDYKVKCSWRMIRRIGLVDLYHLRRLDEGIPLCHDYILYNSELSTPIALIFVPSLVSPHCDQRDGYN